MTILFVLCSLLFFALFLVVRVLKLLLFSLFEAGFTFRSLCDLIVGYLENR